MAIPKKLDDILKQFTPKDLNTNSLNYKNHVRLMHSFKQSGGKYSSEFNLFDNPGSVYFKILFHFDTPSGLLHPTWNYASGSSITPSFNPNAAEELDWYTYSTAYSYLQLNDELERAEYLKQFILLLSNINSESPWYFSSINGLSDAVTRNNFFKDPKIETSEKRKITINSALPDTIDQRLMTLMDLYRHLTYSYTHKRIILPSNLRKFDMSIVLYSLPIKRLHTPTRTPKITDALGAVGKYIENIGPSNSTTDTSRKGYANFGSIDKLTNEDASKSEYVASFKVFDFIGCEFNFPGEPYGEINNGTEGFGFKFKPSIEINYDECLETRYNEFLPELIISDLLKLDTTRFSMFDPSKRSGESIEDTSNILYDYEDIKKNVGNRKTYTDISFEDDDTLTNQALGVLSSYTAPKVTQKVVLGNIYGFSLSDAVRTANEALDLQVPQTIQALRKDIFYKNFREGMKRGDGSNRGFIKSKLS